MTDWDLYLACEVCPATLGVACYTLSAGGPQALPARFAEVPHSSRKMRGERPRTAPRKPANTEATDVVARRKARKTASATAGWAAIARAQGKL